MVLCNGLGKIKTLKFLIRDKYETLQVNEAKTIEKINENHLIFASRKDTPVR
jgi:hypothetical protein